ncbi:hypothetical protein ACNSOL_11780 (plasmid) [Aliarcobacter lanthieri]|uniref:hypothetical protein n=1 Tax=Aliarcobacter lanthieri TaxID=1355374 RepID=UPI003AAE9B7C
MKSKIIDFVNTTGKNIDQVQNTKLAAFFGNTESTIRKLGYREPLKFECLYLGAFCKANNITKEELIKLIKNRG